MSSVESATATETPVVETPVTETPATETPATETTATETSVTETPVTETPATETPATETPATETEEVTKQEPSVDARKFFEEGKDFYLAGTYDQASEKLSQALKLGVEAFGELGAENFDTYLYYGKSLLKKEVAGSTETSEEKTQEESNESSTESKTPQALAREAFEAAKKIVEAQDEKSSQLSKAKVDFAFGEVLVKENNYTEAITFFLKALELYSANSEVSNDEVVESQIALAKSYEQTKEIAKAQELYTKAKETISARTEGTEEDKAKNLKEVEDLEKKIAELKPEPQQSAEEPTVEATQTDENATEVSNEVTEKIDDTVRQGVKRTAEITSTDETKRLKEINNE